MSAVSVRSFNRTLLLACSPFLGMLIWLIVENVRIELPENAFPRHSTVPSDPGATTASVLDHLNEAEGIAKWTGKSIQKQLSLYNKTNADMNKIASLASTQAARPYQIYDRRITNKLGKPAATIQSDKLQAQLFYLGTQNFRSYALKIKLKKDDAMKLVLGNDVQGGSETTLAAVNRYKAAIGVNAGDSPTAEANGILSARRSWTEIT